MNPAMEVTNGKKIDFRNPYWLRSIGGVIEVAKVRPVADKPADDSEFDHLITGCKDAIHSIVNNTCRAAGVDMGGADSEHTWEWCKVIGEKVEEFIRHEWTRQDALAEQQKEQDRADAQMLSEYLAKVNAARERHGLPKYHLQQEYNPE
jgi:hypothetical protein